MTKVFDYKLYELKSLRKRNIVIGIACFVVGFVIALLLLLLHNRSNSILMSVFCIISIIAFTIAGLTFLLIFNAPISKISQLVKKGENALVNDYFIEKIDDNVFAQDGLAFRKITLVGNDNSKQVFYLEKNISLNDAKKIKIATVGSIIVSFEVLE